MTRIYLICCLLLFSSAAFPQVDTIKGAEAQRLIKEILPKAIDTASFLNVSGRNACKCIDSITLTNKESNEISKQISDCIDKEVSSYQLSVKLYRSMMGMQKENKIDLDVNKNSNEYRRYYYDIERWLRDSCQSMNRAVASNNKESELSVSKSENAQAAYNRGVIELNKENYQEASSYFATAVAMDSMFAFAWDNLGICYRRLGKLDEALYAYNRSLRVDPRGKLPLQNIPVVYEYKKDYDKALEGYMNILKFYPDDPEAYYGAGRIYASFKQDYEKALQNMCKAYTIYTSTNSPYRVDAEKNISFIYGKMKEAGNEKRFHEILKENNIKAQ